MASVVLGVDVSKATLDAALLIRESGKVRTHAKVGNDAIGVMKLGEWARQQSGLESKAIRVVMEATAEYHERAVELFHAAGFEVIVANPKHVKRYAEGHGTTHKNDRHDARKIAIFGERRNLYAWEPPPEAIRELRALIIRFATVSNDARRERNRRKREDTQRIPAAICESYTRVIDYYRGELAQVEDAIEAHYAAHPDLAAKRALLLSIPSVGERCADYLLWVLSDRKYGNARRAAAILGLVPLSEQSGSSINRPAHLSGEGNRRCRAALYMAALCAIRRTRQGGHGNAELRAIYDRLVAAGKPKKAALLAVVRHIVHVAYGILRHGQRYNPALVTGVTREERRELQAA